MKIVNPTMQLSTDCPTYPRLTSQATGPTTLVLVPAQMFLGSESLFSWESVGPRLIFHPEFKGCSFSVS